MGVRNKFLFNFAASYLGGGFKRLYEYAKWFDRNGGAWFVIHPHRASLVQEFPNVRFFVVDQPRAQRVFNDCAYLAGIEREIGRPDFYYSYGIPIYAPVGRLNWFHLSNVLPLGARGISLPLATRLTSAFLGWRIMSHLHHADVISAESQASLDLLDPRYADRLFLSVNGSDDELAYLEELRQGRAATVPDAIATLLGTFSYKRIQDSWQVFDLLRRTHPGLKLVIIGNADAVPAAVRQDPDVVLTGVLARRELVDWLRRTSYYISTTQIENSYNAAAEGIVFATESYISDIGPHRELIAGVPHERISVPHVARPLIHVRRRDLSDIQLQSWDAVITGMVAHMWDTIRA